MELETVPSLHEALYYRVNTPQEHLQPFFKGSVELCFRGSNLKFNDRVIQGSCYIKSQFAHANSFVIRGLFLSLYIVLSIL